uniref:Uncharacterized protein n=1 Tax=Arundo donax TaxID=35708 RepID=A0A0A9EX35_ARUDO
MLLSWDLRCSFDASHISQWTQKHWII